MFILLVGQYYEYLGKHCPIDVQEKKNVICLAIRNL